MFSKLIAQNFGRTIIFFSKRRVNRNIVVWEMILLEKQGAQECRYVSSLLNFVLFAIFDYNWTTIYTRGKNDYGLYGEIVPST